MQTVLITGGNSGLGYETAKKFLTENYKVIITCRNTEKAAEAVQNLKTETGKTQIEALTIELNSIKSIKKAIDSFNNQIDILICNAGMAYDSPPIKYSKDGLEETFAVNHLAHFFISNLFLAKNNGLKKILLVSSNLHAPELSKGFAASPQMDDLNLLAYPEANEKIIDKKKIAVFYPNSKLCNVLTGYDLAQKYPDVICNVFNPGFMPSTGLPRYQGVFIKWLLKNVFPIFGKIFKSMRNPEGSANDIFEVISSAKESGKYYDGLNLIKSSELSYNKALTERLRNFSNKLIASLS